MTMHALSQAPAARCAVVSSARGPPGIAVASTARAEAPGDAARVPPSGQPKNPRLRLAWPRSCCTWPPSTVSFSSSRMTASSVAPGSVDCLLRTSVAHVVPRPRRHAVGAVGRLYGLVGKPLRMLMHHRDKPSYLFRLVGAPRQGSEYGFRHRGRLIGRDGRQSHAGWQNARELSLQCRPRAPRDVPAGLDGLTRVVRVQAIVEVERVVTQLCRGAPRCFSAWRQRADGSQLRRAAGAHDRMVWIDSKGGSRELRARNAQRIRLTRAGKAS